MNCFISISFFIFLLMCGCNNTTSIKGIIKNARTGEPIEGATGWVKYKYRAGITYDGGMRFTTGPDGQFSFSEKNIYMTQVEVDWLNGFALKMRREGSVEDNECNELTVLATPRDGILKMTITNESGTADSLFLLVINDGDFIPYIQVYAQKPQVYPMKLAQNEQTIAYFSTCKGESTLVKWAFNGSFHNQQKDTIQILMSDTTGFDFSY